MLLKKLKINQKKVSKNNIHSYFNKYSKFFFINYVPIVGGPVIQYLNFLMYNTELINFTIFSKVKVLKFNNFFKNIWFTILDKLNKKHGNNTKLYKNLQIKDFYFNTYKLLLGSFWFNKIFLYCNTKINYSNDLNIVYLFLNKSNKKSIKPLYSFYIKNLFFTKNLNSHKNFFKKKFLYKFPKKNKKYLNFNKLPKWINSYNKLIKINNFKYKNYKYNFFKRNKLKLTISFFRNPVLIFYSNFTNNLLTRYNIVFFKKNKLKYFNNLLFSKNFYYYSNKLNIFTQKNLPFIFSNTGLFLISRFNYNYLYRLRFKNKYNFKKQYFSFLSPNQLKYSIFLKKKKIIVSRFFKTLKHSNNSFIRKTIYNLLTFRFRDYFVSNITKNTKIVFKKETNKSTHSSMLFYSGFDESYKFGEVFIKRIRFKPGYQRIWRDVRSSLKESLKLKYAYQYRLTRFLTRFSISTSNYFLCFTELSLERVTLYSKLLPDLNTFLLFMSRKYIYVSGKLIMNNKALINTGDIVQILISKWYYILNRWLVNWTKIRLNKFKRLVFKKGLPFKYKLMKTRKQKSRYTPNWILNVDYDLTDVKPWLEVDYFSLSVMYLYEPFILNTQPVKDLSRQRQSIYRMYNWKYIT